MSTKKQCIGLNFTKGTLPQGKACDHSKGYRRRTILDEFETDKLIGAPFSVVLHDAVTEISCNLCGEILDLEVPQFAELVGVIALLRTFEATELSGKELRFLRRSLNRKSLEMAKILGIRPETYSRLENSQDALPAPIEKAFRHAVGNGHNELAELIGKNVRTLLDLELRASKLPTVNLRFDLMFNNNPPEPSYREKLVEKDGGVWSPQQGVFPHNQAIR